RFQQRYQQLRDEQPDRYGEKISEKDRAAIQQQIIATWQTIAPGQRSTFIFPNLNEARSYSTLLQFRFKAKAAGSTPDEMVHLGFQFNEGMIEPLSVADDNFYVKPLDIRAVTPQGFIKLSIYNLGPPVEQGGVSISFPPGDGLQVFY